MYPWRKHADMEHEIQDELLASIHRGGIAFTPTMAPNQDLALMRSVHDLSHNAMALHLVTTAKTKHYNVYVDDIDARAVFALKENSDILGKGFWR